MIVACNDEQKTFLKAEFSQLETVFLPGYDIQYSFNKVRTTLKIFVQSGKILTAIKEEYLRLRKIIHEFPIDLIISDNRYGFYHPDVYSILISHQLTVRSGLGSFADLLVNQRLSRYINHFNENWIPDNDTYPVLAGKLSTPFLKRDKQFYIGPVSRFQRCVDTKRQHILVLLSGPEPQRAILETMILDHSHASNIEIVLVRGSRLSLKRQVPQGVVVYDFAETSQLNKLMCDASIIISRSGYTSIMDILKIQKQWIVIPTPGQAEQEYLAGYLHENRWAYAVSQTAFNLADALKAASQFEFDQPEIDTEKFKLTIARILNG